MSLLNLMKLRVSLFLFLLSPVCHTLSALIFPVPSPIFSFSSSHASSPFLPSSILIKGTVSQDVYCILYTLDCKLNISTASSFKKHLFRFFLASLRLQYLFIQKDIRYQQKKIILSIIIQYWYI